MRARPLVWESPSLEKEKIDERQGWCEGQPVMSRKGRHRAELSSHIPTEQYQYCCCEFRTRMG
jgi:hypothetical protein